MKLTTYHRPLLRLPAFPDWDELLDELITSPVSNQAPETRIHQDKNVYRLETDLPGIHKDDLKLSIESGILNILATRKVTSGENNQEFRYERNFQIPQDVESEKITAELQDGVLSLTFPKKESSKPRTLEITVK